MINQFSKNPQQLFLLDGLGAVLSAFLLGVVLVRLESYFGIPVSTLYILAALPVFFAVFDAFCYYKGADRYGSLLKVIAIVNLLYCCLSLGFAFFHFEKITYLGWGYIIIEVLIVLAIARLEFQVADLIS